MAPLAYLGRISYSVYIVHPILGFVLERAGTQAWLTEHVFVCPSLVHAALLLSSSLIIATMSWRLFERRMLTHKDLLERKIGESRRARTATV
jgi:peptidoglycan/LPS O-acetylase OafA/YrhL